jgi:hypothetical protein
MPESSAAPCFSSVDCLTETFSASAARPTIGTTAAGIHNDKEAEVLGLIAKIGHEVAGLLGGPASVGVLVVPRMWT